MQDGFGIVGIFHVLRNSEDVSTLANVVLYVFVGTLISELGHFNFLRRKLLVQVEQVKRRGRQVFDAG